MATTVTLLRQTYCNGYLGRVDGSTLPWSDTQVDRHIVDALTKLWPRVGRRLTGTVATSQASGLYTIPGSIKRVSRIVLEEASGGVTAQVDRVPNWRYHSDTQVWINPRLITSASLVLRFYGWGPFATDATDLPVDLEATVAERAVALAYGSLAGVLANSQRQQGLDSGRVVDYQTAVGLSAYYERRYFDGIEAYPARVGSAPRSAYR